MFKLQLNISRIKIYKITINENNFFNNDNVTVFNYVRVAATDKKYI